MPVQAKIAPFYAAAANPAVISFIRKYMQNNVLSEYTSTWRSRLRALGPGVLLASAAVGGSHLIASTQAGALYGWQLAVIILLVNVLK